MKDSDKKLKNFMEVHAKLVRFMEPIAKEHCSPCKHNRGPYGCCADSAAVITKVIQKLSGVNGVDGRMFYGSGECGACENLNVNIGCTLKFKPTNCLCYLCAPVIRSLGLERTDEYWALREELSNAEFEFEK